MNINWTPVFDSPINFNTQVTMLPTKGKLVYEYNPLRNYRLSQNMYEYKNQLYSKEELESNFKITMDSNKWLGVPTTETDPILHEKGELVDFNTSELKVDINHPVHIIPLHSYDGSVNLIINDGINIPRLINSRFSATGKNTYEIVDRKGNNDTNIYDLGELFDVDTSLYKRVVKIPTIKFNGVCSGGNMPVGNYHFYFKFSDADGNETDFVGESGLVSVFIGFDSPFSVHTGQKNQNSYKQVLFSITNIDSSYDYVSVYYSRSTSEGNFNSNTEYIKIDKKFVVNNADVCDVIITGYEDIINVSISDINLHYNTVDAVNTSAVCQNMLFLANVHKPDIPYEELLDLSLRFLPRLKEERYDLLMDLNYSISSISKGYFDPKFIYEKTGYWGEEIYRLGVVYILPNNQLSPVFNIRGAYNVTKDYAYTNLSLFKNGKRNKIEYNEESYIIVNTPANNRENVKGVISLSPNNDVDTIYSFNISIDDDVIEELKKYVKGFFFVRQARIPSILAQGVTIGIDNESRTPTIPTKGGILEQVKNNITNTKLDINSLDLVNYISEGFLHRYTYKLQKDKSDQWKNVGKAALIGVGVVALAAATVFTCGAAAAVAAGTAASVGAATAAGVTALGSAVGGAVMTSVGVAAVGGVVGGATADLIIPDGMEAVDTDDSRSLSSDFLHRFIPKTEDKNSIQGLLCPDYEVNQPFFNLLFTGNTHLLKTSIAQSALTAFDNDGRHFYISTYKNDTNIKRVNSEIVGVPDNIKAVGIQNHIFRSRAGEAEEAWVYECVGNNYELEKNTKLDTKFESNKKINSDIIRGSFGPYLGFIQTSNVLDPCKIVNIYTPGYLESSIDKYFDIRMRDNSTFSAISDRIDISKLHDDSVLLNLNKTHNFNVYRGDCYICLFTHRVNRNFNDPSAPYNDVIVDPNSWKDNYNPDNTEDYNNINLGDVNAVQLGMWVTFKVRSSNNLNIRTIDGSNIDEAAMSGHERGFYPYTPMSVEGSYKIPDSQIYNKGFSKSMSDKWNVQVPDVPHIKNWFGTRIMYSDIHINDAFKNGFRVFQGTNYRDYTREYGEITKLVSLESNLLVVFEHGIGVAPVNERAVAGQGAGGKVYINTSNVLPESLIIISDMFGSQWAESILKVPGKTGSSAQYVYGVDTVAKKIWRTDGQRLDCISDMRVQEFLNNNITLGERELTPKIGIRNVKTMYNAFKRDVLFTFYDNTYGFEEKVWNLCWNELLEKFITFYSWVPSYMENINNIPFSFDRNVSKWIAKLGTSHSDNSFADGVTLSNVIIDTQSGSVDNYNFKFTYINKEGNEVTKTYTVAESSRDNFIGVLSLTNRTLPETSLFYTIDYTIERDNYLNHKLFNIDYIKIKTENGESETITLPEDAMFAGKNVKILALYLKLNNLLNPYQEVYYKSSNETFEYLLDANYNHLYTKLNMTDVLLLDSELYYRNKEKHAYADVDSNKAYGGIIHYDLPIFKDITGKRKMLKFEDRINKENVVRLINIKANIKIETNSHNLSDDYYNLKAGFLTNTSLIDAGYFESTIAISTKWNTQFLSSDFWKHGQSSIIDITDDIKPTNWYGKQHPFEFECVVVNDPSVHKIFTNLELVANKAKPESFHYEVIGETYDFAKDKVNMYFRQEALKALWLYNGADICYNRNFLKIQPNQLVKSADFPHNYYTRLDTINEIEDYYISITLSANSKYDYKHLSGAEIVYYPTRLEYRVWLHSPAVDLNDLSQDDSRSVIKANCLYLEDRWKITINPILVCYKNEGSYNNGTFITSWTDVNRPKLPVMNSPIPDKAFKNIKDKQGLVAIPPVLSDLGYTANDMDLTSWLKDVNIYGTSFGEALNRREVDVRDKFMKIRIRYSGDELAIIDFLNTIYRVSYA